MNKGQRTFAGPHPNILTKGCFFMKKNQKKTPESLNRWLPGVTQVFFVGGAIREGEKPGWHRKKRDGCTAYGIIHCR